VSHINVATFSKVNVLIAKEVLHGVTSTSLQ